MRPRLKLSTKLLAFLLALVFAISQPLSVMGGVDGSTAYNQEIVAYLTNLYGEDGARQVLDSMYEMGLIDRYGNFRTYSVEVDGHKLTTAELEALVNDPDTDLTKTCTVDGQTITLQDVKTMLEIEAELQRIRDTYYNNGITLTAEHQSTLQSLIQQLQASGIDLQVEDSETKDNAAIALGYKSQLARVSVSTADLSVNQGSDATVTFTLTKSLPYPVSFDYKTVDGAAKAGIHYTAQSGTVTFQAGETSKSISIKTTARNSAGTDYTNDRWTGDRAFLIQYYNAKNVLFDNDKTTRNTLVRIQGNYAYGDTVELLQKSFFEDTTGYGLHVSGRDLKNQPIVPYDGDQGSTQWLRLSKDGYKDNNNNNYAGFYLAVPQKMKDMVNEDLVTSIHYMVSLESSWGGGTYGTIYISMPGVQDKVPNLSNVIASKEGNFPGVQFGSGEWGELDFDLTNASNKSKFLADGASMSFHIFARDVEDGGPSGDAFKAQAHAQLYFVDKTAPRATGVQIPAGTYNPGERVPIVVTYSEPVNSANARVTLNTGAVLSPAESSSTYSRQLTFYYDVQDTDAGSIRVTKASGAVDMAGKTMADYSCNASASLGDMEKTQAFQSLSLDTTSYYPGQTTGTLTVTLDQSKSAWLEQEGALNLVKASVDGGKTLLDLTLINEGQALQAAIPLEQYVDGADHEKRVELYLSSTGNAGDFSCVIGKYVDYVIHPVEFVKAEDMSIVYPTEWPSGRENLVYLTAASSTVLRYTYSGDATYKDFAWSSDNEDVAKIDPSNGTILPQAPGEVTFRLTALNNGADESQNVSIQTVTITVNPGGEPSLVIPEDMNTVVITQGNPAEIRWSTNVIYKNQTDYNPPRDTDFTLTLYQGNLTPGEISSATPLHTYTQAETGTLRNVTSFSIPADMVGSISVGGVPSYTVKVEVKHPENDSILTAYAYILVNSPAAVVRLDRLTNDYLLDTAGQVAFEWRVDHFDSLNEGQFELKVSRNDEVIDSTVVTFADGQFSVPVTDNGDNSYSGTCVVPLADVTDGTLSDVYTVNIKAKNKNESTWSYDSFPFYVYNADALEIMVDGQSTDSLLLSNIQGISGMSSAEILALNRNITLRKAISINYGAYTWKQVTDKISWAVENSSIASVNYSQGGRYDNIENFSYTTYRPSEEFILSGRDNGTTTIRATHAATGMTDTLEVRVETLRDKLYIFQASPKTTTDVTYTTYDEGGQTVEKAVQTDANGALAIYEEKGIVGDVRFKSTYNSEVYMGTVAGSSLQSGEVDVTDVGLYPINNVKLRQPAHVVFYLRQPDGTPYTGSVTYRGGVYKNNQYCDASTNIDGTTVDLGTDGKLDISLDVTTFWIDGVDTPAAELYPTDNLDFMFEVLPEGTDYYPLLLKQSGNLGTDDLVKSADMVVTLDQTDGKAEPFIARQIHRDNYPGAKEIDVRKYNKKIGPNTDFPDTALETTVMWWGMEEEDLADASLKLVDEYGVVPTGQTYQTFKYPFSTITVTQNTQVFNESTLWMQQKYSRGLSMQLNKDENTLYKTFSLPFRVINMLGTESVIDPDSGTISIIATIKDSMTVDGGSMDLGDAFIGAGLSALEATSFSTPIFTMQIAATQDPTVYNVLIKAGYGNMDGGDTTGLYMTAEREEVNTDPSPTDKLAMLKDEYLADDPLDTKMKKRAKYGAGELYYELSGYYEGQVVYDYEEGRWESVVHTGGFTAGGGFGYQWNFNSWVGPVPVTAELGLGAAVAVDFGVKALYEEQTYDGVLQAWDESVDDEYVTDYLTTLRIYAYLNAFGGLGFDYSVLAFKFGVFGQIALDSRNTWLNREYLADESQRRLNGQSLTLEGRVGIKFYARFLFISYEKILTSYTYTKTWLYNNWEKIYDYWEKTTGGRIDQNNIDLAIDTYIAAHPMVEEVSSAARMESRNYLSKFTRSWNSGGGIQLFSLDPENGAPKELQTNAYPYANPQLAEDGSLFVYLSDGDSENVEDTAASWAVRSGSGYADQGAIPVDTQGFGDSSLQFAGTRDKGAAVWVQQQSGLDKDAGDALTEAEQALMANGTEIMVSRMENGQWTAERLTENSTPDMAPVVAVNGDRIFVAWRSVYVTNQNNVTDFTGSDTILYRVYKDGVWSEPDTLYNGTSGNVMGLQAAMLEDGTAAITYTLNKGQADAAVGLADDRSEQLTTEEYEIVYAVVDTDTGTVHKNQQITSDNELDENPQITTVQLDGTEYFVLGWYNVSTTGSDETGDLKTVSDIRLAVVDGLGNIRTADVGFVDSLATASGGQNVAVDSNFRFVRSADGALQNLSLIWAATAGDNLEDSENATDSGLLQAVRFVQDGDQVHASAVIDVAQMADGAQIDHFDAYAAGGNTVKAVILGTKATGEMLDSGEVTQEPTGEVDENGDIIYTETPLLVPETVSGMYTATETYENALSIPTVDTELKNMVKGLSLPVEFTIQNDGIQFIDGITVDLDGQTTTFDSSQIRLQPGQNVQVTADYQVPETQVVNPTYTITAHFTDGSQKTVSDTLHLAIPDVGISAVTVTKEADGIRDFTVTLYNDSEVELAGSSRHVKLGVYADSDYQETLLDVVTLSSDDQLQAVDEGAYVHKFSFNIKDHIQSLGYDEIPESGIPVYIKAWIVDGEQEVEVAEYNTVNNESLQQLYSLQKDMDGQSFKTSAELTNGEVTTADITLQNLTMQEVRDQNVVVNLLDASGSIIESEYLATNAEELLQFGPEGIVTATVAFSQPGSSVEVTRFAASADTMDGHLADLKASGIGFSFDADQVEYNLQAENKTTTNITAIAKGGDAAVTIRDSKGQILGTGTGTAVATVPLAYTSLNGEAVSGAENQITVEVQPTGEGAGSETYTLLIQNNQRTAGTVAILPPTADYNSWVNAQTDQPQATVSAENLEGFTAESLEYSLDGGITWQEAAASPVILDLSEDKVYDLRARVTDTSGARITANPAVVRVDRTVPQLSQDILLEETDLPLVNDNAFARFFRSFTAATNKQMKVTVTAADATSGIQSVIVSTADGDSYALADNGDGTYTGMITKSYEGILTVTATDQAGNISIVYSEDVLIDDQLPAPEMQLDYDAGSLTADEVDIAGSVAFQKDNYFKEVKVMYRKAGEEDWKTAKTYTDAEEAKDIRLTIDGLDPAAQYDIQLAAYNIVGDSGVVKSIQVTTRFATPDQPEMESKTSRAITLQTVEGAQYRRLIDAETGEWTAWQSSPAFGDLSPNTAYTFEMRIAAAEGAPESFASTASFTTYPLYAVLFDKNTDDAVTDLPDMQNVGYMETATQPETEPQRTGYTFTGWYTDEDCKEEDRYDFSTGRTETLHLYAGWSENVVTEADYTVTGEKNGDWYTGDVVIRPAGDYEAIWDGEKWDTSYVIKEGEAQEVTFKLKKIVDGKEVETTFLHEPLELSVDTTAPTGQITIEENGWKEFLNTITFGLFFKETVDVDITGEDATSGVGSIAYVKSDAARTEAELAEAEWTEGDAFSVEPDDKFVVYARIADEAGHTTLLSSDGIITDASGPVIEATYDMAGEWTTDSGAAIQVAVSDTLAGIQSITYTVDGQQYTAGEERFTITDLPDGDYDVVVTATDLSGNQTSETVHVKKDAVAPSLTVTGNATAWTNEDVELQIARNEANASGQTLYVSKDGGAETELPAGTESYTVSENGEYTFRLVTGAGLEATSSVTVHTIDKDAPTLEVTYDKDGEWNTDEKVSVSVQAADEASGIRTVEYEINGQPYTSDEAEFVITDLPDGEYDVIVTAIDEAGNRSEEQTIQVKREGAKPGMSISATPAGPTTGAVTLTVDLLEQYASGVTLYVSKDGGKEEMLPAGALAYRATENGVYTFRLVTGAGQEATISCTVNQIQPPSDTPAKTGDSGVALPALALLAFAGGAMVVCGFGAKRSKKRS